MKMDFDSDNPSAHGNGAAGLRFRPAEQAVLDDNLRRGILASIPGLRRYARALTRDVAAADDLVQDCLCRALAKIHTWEPDTDLRAWLFTILHHQHVSEIRRVLRRGVTVALDDDAPPLSVAADALSSLQLRDLERAIAGLPEAQRQVILLIGLEGMAYEDVAATLGIPIGTVRSRIARSRAALRKLLNREDGTANPADAPASSEHKQSRYGQRQ